jgi:hypothetical protein
MDEMEWIFSSLVGWNDMPIEVVNKINDYKCMWNYYGKVVIDDNYADPEEGLRNNFFIMKSDGQWRYRIEPGTFVFDGYCGRVKSRTPKKKTSLFGGMKIYKNEKDKWTNECDF